MNSEVKNEVDRIGYATYGIDRNSNGTFTLNDMNKQSNYYYCYYY